MRGGSERREGEEPVEVTKAMIHNAVQRARFRGREDGESSSAIATARWGD